MIVEKENVKDLSSLAETSIIALYIRAIETQSQNPMIKDEKAVDMMKKIEYDYQKLKKKIPKFDMIFGAMRVRQFDQYVKDFLSRFPDGVIVSIGSGLDARFDRIDNGKVLFYDLDLPEVIQLREKFLQETERNRFIASSVLDFQWVEQLEPLKDRRFMFIAEGVFMHLHGDEVKSLVLKLCENFPGSELVFDIFNTFVVDHNASHPVIKRMDITLHWGMKNSKELESWNKGIEFLDDWYYLGQKEKRLGIWGKLFHMIPKLNKMTWLVHYRLS